MFNGRKQLLIRFCNFSLMSLRVNSEDPVVYSNFLSTILLRPELILILFFSWIILNQFNLHYQQLKLELSKKKTDTKKRHYTN